MKPPVQCDQFMVRRFHASWLFWASLLTDFSEKLQLIADAYCYASTDCYETIQFKTRISLLEAKQ
jgi:hypothetical protein